MLAGEPHLSYRLLGDGSFKGQTLCGSDMLVWSRDETPEGAAFPILNALFSTIQYSMVLERLPSAHAEVIRHWINFTRTHREALLKGRFRPHHPENGYTWIEGESAKERIIAAYAHDVCVNTGTSDRQVFLVNATGGKGLLAEFTAAARVEFFDVFGKPAGFASVAEGISRLNVPVSGFAKVVW